MNLAADVAAAVVAVFPVITIGAVQLVTVTVSFTAINRVVATAGSCRPLLLLLVSVLLLFVSMNLVADDGCCCCCCCSGHHYWCKTCPFSAS